MQPDPEHGLDILWGCAAIAKVIGKTQRATFHLLERGQIPARKVGAQWCVSRRKLREYFETEVAGD